jgi:hypothetical protein
MPRFTEKEMPAVRLEPARDASSASRARPRPVDDATSR